jgi:hypothetical protein
MGRQFVRALLGKCPARRDDILPEHVSAVF